MEPLTTFTDEEVFGNIAPSNWVKVTPSRRAEPTEPADSWEYSHSWNQRARARGVFRITSGMGQSRPITTTPEDGPLATSSLRAETQLGSTIIQWQMPPPEITEITKTCCRNDEPHVVMGVPPELADGQSPIQVTGYTTFSVRLLQDEALGVMYINMMACAMSLVGLAVTLSATDPTISTLLGEEDDSD